MLRGKVVRLRKGIVAVARKKADVQPVLPCRANTGAVVLRGMVYDNELDIGVAVVALEGPEEALQQPRPVAIEDQDRDLADAGPGRRCRNCGTGPLS